MILQEPVNAVHISSEIAAGNNQPLTGCPQHIALISQLFEINIHAGLFKVFVVSQNNLMLANRESI